tara:strand:+ start:176 stop:2512 length:2337 start_codon:yes stop_codon:yes gene_type:complete
MRVSTLKKVTQPANTTDADVYNVLNDIKTEKYRKIIAEVRLETDKEVRSKLKVDTLPCAIFGGTFSYRRNDDLKKSSGLACLDYDGVEDLDKLIKEVNKDDYTFASFISPSGDGLKVLVKIPPVPTDKVFKEYYHELIKYYSKYYLLDDCTIDIARATFLSSDKNTYINADSVMFTDKFIAPIRDIAPVTNVPLTDQNEIAERLEKWFLKNYSTTIKRNNNLHIWALSFNNFGVDQSICETYLMRYEQPDFKEREILLLIKSAYKHTEDFNTKSFEDNDKVKKIKNLVTSGKKSSEIKSSIKDIDEKDLEEEIEKHQSELRLDEFWTYTEKDAIKMATYRFLQYLEYNNISKYYPSENSGYLFIKKDNNFIKEFNNDRIKDFTLNDLRNRGEIEAFEMCAKNTLTFSHSYLSMIGTSNIEIQRDTASESFIFYKNTAVKVKKSDFELIPYSDLKGLVWENQIIDRDLQLSEKSDGEFKTFIWKISGEDKARYYTMKSVLGYLLHSFQNEGKPRVIIFNDEMISDAPNGGSGKGLIHKALSYIKKLSTINGKGFDPTTQFAYQTVNPDTQVLLFDDIDKNFKFENLFSLITEGITIEKKGKDAVKIPFVDSPKISITTNYTVKGEGGSHERRVFEVEMSSYFNSNHTPEDEFNHLLFSEWSDEEWEKFDNYMLRCIQYYLENGLVESKTINLDLRKLRNDTNPDFIEFMENLSIDGTRYYGTELKDLLTKEYEDFQNAPWFKTRLFNEWLTKYCKFKGFALDKKQTNGKRYIAITEVPF